MKGYRVSALFETRHHNGQTTIKYETYIFAEKEHAQAFIDAGDNKSDYIWHIVGDVAIVEVDALEDGVI